MKAITYDTYGPPDVLKSVELEMPTPADNEVLVKIQATSVTTGDYRARSLDMPAGFGLIGRLVFGVFGPRHKVLGTEFAGEIVAIGKAVKQFNIGDAIFAYPGAALGGYAQYAVLAEDKAIARKPANLTSQEAVALSFGGATALNFLRDKAGIKPGDKVLINGASGGVGTAAVQLAKHFGAEVTGVCSTANLDLVRSIGADIVVDYTSEDFSRNGQSYDIILDTTGTLSYAGAEKSLKTNGRFLMVAGSLGQMLKMIFARKKDGKKGIAGYAPELAEELRFLAHLAETGAYRPVIDRCYSMDKIVEAHAYVDTGRKRGNVVIAVD